MSQQATQGMERHEVQSVAQFCRVVEEYARQSEDPRLTARLCETQAEMLRINRQDVCVETIDLLLETLLNTLHHVAGRSRRSRWSFFSRLFVLRSQKTRKHSPQTRKPTHYNGLKNRTDPSFKSIEFSNPA